MEIYTIILIIVFFLILIFFKPEKDHFSYLQYLKNITGSNKKPVGQKKGKC